MKHLGRVDGDADLDPQVAVAVFIKNSNPPISVLASIGRPLGFPQQRIRGIYASTLYAYSARNATRARASASRLCRLLLFRMLRFELCPPCPLSSGDPAASGCTHVTGLRSLGSPFLCSRNPVGRTHITFLGCSGTVLSCATSTLGGCHASPCSSRKPASRLSSAAACDAATRAIETLKSIDGLI